MVKVSRNEGEPSRFKGVTNNGGSRGEEGRLLRRLYTDHGITPPANLGTTAKKTRYISQLPRDRFVGIHQEIPDLPEGKRKKKRHNGSRRR